MARSRNGVVQRWSGKYSVFLFSLTCVAYVLLILRDLEGIADDLQSLLKQCLLERVIKASRVEGIIKDSVDKVEQALRKYEVWLAAAR